VRTPDILFDKKCSARWRKAYAYFVVYPFLNLETVFISYLTEDLMELFEPPALQYCQELHSHGKVAHPIKSVIF